MKEELKEDIKNIFLIVVVPIICLVIGWGSNLFSKEEISFITINLFITVFLNLCFVFAIKYGFKSIQKPKMVCFLWSVILLIIATINNGTAVNGVAFIYWYYINCSMLKVNESKKNFQDDKKDLEETNRYINQFTKIRCKVCNKVIEYNEYGTCEECHQKILKRLEEKNKKKQL